MKDKRKIRRIIHFSFLLGVLVIGVLTFNAMTPIKANPEDDTKAAIGDTSFNNWTAESLVTAQQETNEFLANQKVSGAPADRPYKGNISWTEGSLMAVEKAYQSSLSATEGASSDLARMLLIETVRKLEVRTVFEEKDPRLLSVNNYPNDNGEYDLEYAIPSVEEDNRTLKYSVMFVLDWSGSMSSGIGTYSNARLRAKADVESLSRYVIENYEGSKVYLLGYNARINNSGEFNRQVNTGFFGKESNYLSIINSAFSMEPAYGSDDVPAFIADATSLMNTRYDPDSIPVIVTMSDFQLSGKFNGITTPDRYGLSLRSYWDTFRMKPQAIADPQKRPIHLAVRYDHTGNVGNSFSGPTALKWQTDNMVGRDRWGFLIIDRKNVDTSTTLIRKLLTDSLPVRPSTKYNMESRGTDFEFVPNSLISDNNTTTLTVNEPASINLSNTENDTGSLKVNSLASAVMNKKMGDLLPSYTESNLKFVNSEYESSNKVVKGLPQLFSPVTEAAIELYSYKGTGDKSDSANYERKQTIVGNHFNIHGGTTVYPLKNEKLSSIKYNTTLTKAEVLEVVKSTLGQSEYDKLLFNNELVAPSQKMTFDAAKNVYKLYTEVNETELKIMFVDENGVNIIPPIDQIKSVGEKVDLTKDKAVLDAINEILGKHYELTGRPTEQFQMDSSGKIVIYSFTGKLILVSAPPKIDFGIMSGSALNEVNIAKPEYSVPLVVLDNRANSEEWNLSVKLETPFSNVSDRTSILPEALVYKRGSEETILRVDPNGPPGNGNSVLITEQTSTRGEEYNVSDKEWELDGNGFSFQLKKGQTRKFEEYTATLVYTLSEVP